MEMLTIKVGYDSAEAAAEAAAQLQEQGAEVHIENEPGFLPLPALLIIVLPEVVLLARVVERMILDWKGRGIVVDARGTGAPVITKDTGLPYGTVVLLTRDGDKAVRTDLSEEKLSDYIVAAVKAVMSGASASGAASAAAAVVKEAASQN